MATITYKKDGDMIVSFNIISAKEALLLSLTDEERVELSSIMSKIEGDTVFKHTSIEWTDAETPNVRKDVIFQVLRNEGYCVMRKRRNTYEQVVYSISWDFKEG